MTTYSLTDASGLIVNRIDLENVTDWPVPDGLTLVAEMVPMNLGGSYINGVYTPPPAPAPAAPPPPSILSQDLMAQFTADDAAKIQTAVASNPPFWLLWSALQAQKDPMVVTNARFLAGWNALIQVLGQPRMDAIAAALSVTVA